MKKPNEFNIQYPNEFNIQHQHIYMRNHTIHIKSAEKREKKILQIKYTCKPKERPRHISYKQFIKKKKKN